MARSTRLVSRPEIARGAVSPRDAVFYGASLVVGLGAFTAMFMINDPKHMYALVGPMNTAFDLAALIFAIVICRRTGFRPQTRRAWKWLAASAFARLLSVIAYAAFLNWQHFPAPGDVLRLLMVPLTMAGLLALPRRPGGRLEWRKLLLDVTAVFAGGAMLMWYFVAGPAIAAQNLPPDTVAAAIALPIGDLAMIFGVLVAIRRGVDPVVRRPLFLFAGGLVAEIAGTSYLGYTLTHQHSNGKLAWQLGCWLVGHFLLAAAAYEQLRHRRSAEEPETAASLQRISRAPYLGVGLGITLLITAALRERQAYPWSGLVAGTVVITIAIALRQGAVLRENQEMATTDSLTTLANRARLHDALGRALAGAQRSGTAVCVLLADLNGFKLINDTLGHSAGDELLKAFAAMLRRSVLGSDIVGRLGGDEFAAIIHDIGSAENAKAIIRRIHAEMEMPIMVGEVVVRVEAAVGYALSEPGESDVSELFHRADADMYRVKRLGKARDAEPRAAP